MLLSISLKASAISFSISSIILSMSGKKNDPRRLPNFLNQSSQKDDISTSV